MRFALPLILVSATALSVSAHAGEPPKQDEEKTEGADKAEETKKICKQVSEGVGSRRMKRVCMTREQWRANNRGN